MNGLGGRRAVRMKMVVGSGGRGVGGELGLQSVAVCQNVGLKKKGDILEWVFIMIGSVCKDVLSSV